MSRKRNQGKARRAKCQRNQQLQAQGQAPNANSDSEQQHLEMCSLLSSLSLEEEVDSGCNHISVDSPPDGCRRFVNYFNALLSSAFDEQDSFDVSSFYTNNRPDLPHVKSFQVLRTIMECIQKEGLYTLLHQQHCRRYIQTYLIRLATNQLLKRERRFMKMAAAIAFFVVELEGAEKRGASVEVKAKMHTILGGTDRDVICYFAKRVDCTCLQQMCSQAKAEMKMGSCNQCYQRMERKNLLVCSLCQVTPYCGKECQRLAWPEHRETCEKGALVHLLSMGTQKVPRREI